MWRKMACGGKWPVEENGMWRKMACGGKWPVEEKWLVEENCLWMKMCILIKSKYPTSVRDLQRIAAQASSTRLVSKLWNENRYN